MADSRKANKRSKCFGIPIEVCVKYERLAGVKTGEQPTKQQRDVACKMMVDALIIGVAGVVLSSKDYELISKETAENESRR